MKKGFLLFVGCLMIVMLLFFKHKEEKTYSLEAMLNSDDYIITENTYEKDIYFDIDLVDIKNNIGMIVFEKDNCFIDIKSMTLQSNNQYDILFQTHGYFTQYKGLLYTGNHYSNSTENTMLSSDHHNWYLSSHHYNAEKDGDYFGFSIDMKKIEHSTIRLKMCNLNYIEIVKSK